MQRNAILEMFPIGPEHIDSRRFDPVTAVMGGSAILGGVTSIIGGSKQAKAAQQAAELQRASAAEAQKKLVADTQLANSGVAGATSAAQQGVTTAANYAVDTAGQGANRALETAAQSNKLLDPYSQAGTTAADYLNKGLAEGGDFNHKATMADYQFDPSVDWVRKQQELALQRKQAASGGAMGGGAFKEAMDYNYGLSSQETAKAFDRGQADTAARYARLFGTAGMGLTAGTTQGNNLNTAARYAGDTNLEGARMNLQGQQAVGGFGMQGAGIISGNTMDSARQQADIITGRGNAEGASKIIQGNAWNNAATGVGNAAINAAGAYAAYKNPATTGGGYYSSSRGRVR